ncbi:threonine/serine exporter family protein [uncultured Pseudoteredinibacter sp.]|uniref:threonine/serine ThrE exporter family protein n=1 Tax=uncultured Pseudoteredinibacter sp. TaxID=1641701 RepID=UPI002638E0B1|nr:threonine/serine exporter family protein [uncultured Pseudoteredinibacter sp.]
MTSASFKNKRKFLIRLAKALHKFGTPAHRLEAHLNNLAAAMELEGSFLVAPTALTFVLWPKGERGNQEYHYTVRVKPGELDLGSLARTDLLVDELINGERDLADALARLEDITSRPPPYPHWLNLIAFGVSGGAFAMLMGTSWDDVVVAFGISLLVYGLIYAAQFSKRLADALEPLSAMLAAFIAVGISQLDFHLNASLVVLASIIAFIPGLALTVGLAELSVRELTSGTARVMDALMLMFKLYFGAVLGMALAYVCWGEVSYQASAPLPWWTSWTAVLMLSASLVIMFKARLRDGVWGILSGIIAYGVSIMAAEVFGVALGTFFGALAVGVYGNIYARWLKSPAIVVTLQGMVILVPGSKIYIGINAVVSGQQIVPSDQIGSQAFLILMSLVAGFIFSNLLVNPKRSL